MMLAQIYSHPGETQPQRRVDRVPGRTIVRDVGLLRRIRQRVLDEAYFLSGHADDEMFADDLEEADVVNAIMKGRITKRYTADPRGARYRVTGPARDGRMVDVVCRFHETGDLIIITVYAEGSAS
jgi:hypothetical protein